MQMTYGKRDLWADALDGSALKTAEAGKEFGYTQIHGMCSTALAFETLGRASSIVEEYLSVAASDIAARHRERGVRAAESRVVLAEEISTLLARAVALRLIRAHHEHLIM